MERAVHRFVRAWLPILSTIAVALTPPTRTQRTSDAARWVAAQTAQGVRLAPHSTQVWRVHPGWVTSVASAYGRTETPVIDLIQIVGRKTT